MAAASISNPTDKICTFTDTGTSSSTYIKLEMVTYSIPVINYEALPEHLFTLYLNGSSTWSQTFRKLNFPYRFQDGGR